MHAKPRSRVDLDDAPACLKNRLADIRRDEVYAGYVKVKNTCCATGNQRIVRMNVFGAVYGSATG